jgi:hypothetical protein
VGFKSGGALFSMIVAAEPDIRVWTHSLIQ